MTLSALMFLPVAATTGCGGSGGQSTKVQMPDKPTPLPAEGDRIEYGRTAIPEGRSIEAR